MSDDIDKQRAEIGKQRAEEVGQLLVARGKLNLTQEEIESLAREGASAEEVRPLVQRAILESEEIGARADTIGCFN